MSLWRSPPSPLSVLPFPVLLWPNCSSAIPPREHTTTSEQIFIVGTSEDDAPIVINGAPVDRSRGGHFAPTLPLELGANTIVVSQGDQRITLQITRTESQTAYDPTNFTAATITPNIAIERQRGEPICFSAIAPATIANPSVTISDQTLSLYPEATPIELPPNSAVLNNRQEFLPSNSTTLAPQFQRWSHCTAFDQPGTFAAPEFRATLNGEPIAQTGGGSVAIAPISPVAIATVNVPEAVARTGSSTNHSRLTPLPQGTRATITGRDGEWLRLDYGGWIKAEEATIATQGRPVHATMRSAAMVDMGDWIEVRIPLQSAVPVSVDQSRDTLRLQLHNTTAETDIIRWLDLPWLRGIQWQQLDPDRVEFRFEFAPEMHAAQQWGYRLRYDDTVLVLSLRKPPAIDADRPLAGVTILLDPGHGGPEDFGTRGPTGYPEKEMTLTIAQLIRDQLEARGARVVMTREDDADLWPHDRVAVIDATEPTIALSLHYNALPDGGDPIATRGISTFWYHPQAEDLARFLHDQLITRLDRDSYGAIWSNFALTRPSNTLAVLLEFGFAINPDEYDWIVDPGAQQDLAETLAASLEIWMRDRQ
ncbi:MAG: N-acetylmuramoyl-L-alanine amidase [Coleofasciculaceae cyanobacterium RL_1_1]|nr:N-acetylmuramoyl-L-alanine amidase [Coleofasciculaceae cyanobacterium RL_1_1]